MHVAFGRVRRKSRIGADSTDDADYGMGDGGRRSRVGNRELGFNGTRRVPTTLYPFLRVCVIRNKLTFLWELLYPIKIPCWGALLGPV